MLLPTGVWAGQTAISVLDAVTFEHKIVLSQGQYNLTVDVTSSIETTAVFQLCDVDIKSIGSNIDGATNVQITVSSTDNNFKVSMMRQVKAKH